MNDGTREIDRVGAEAIARAAIAGKVESDPNSTLQVERSGDSFIVTFLRHDPPGVLAADYDARVTIDARTGGVIELLGGS